MSQPELFHETLNDALREVVQALGGAKKVGALMRPDIVGADTAGRWIHDCLNPERAHRFDPDQVLWLLREGRKAGCHAAMRFLAAECGYAEPVPIDPKVQEDRLLDDLRSSALTLRVALEKIERLEAQRTTVPNFLRKVP